MRMPSRTGSANYVAGAIALVADRASSCRTTASINQINRNTYGKPDATADALEAIRCDAIERDERAQVQAAQESAARARFEEARQRQATERSRTQEEQLRQSAENAGAQPAEGRGRSQTRAAVDAPAASTPGECTPGQARPLCEAAQGVYSSEGFCTVRGTLVYYHVVRSENGVACAAN